MVGIDLGRFDNRAFTRGKPAWFEALWLIVQTLFVSSAILGSAHRRFLLRLFGAAIGEGVVIKSRVRVKFPWRLEIGANSWIGEGVWIDNLAAVTIGPNCCISQEAYICTGNHDWSSATFDLVAKPVRIGAGAWIAARAVVGPGVSVGEGAVLCLGSVASGNLEPWGIYQGVPASLVKARSVGSGR